MMAAWIYRTTLKYDKQNRLERFGEQTTKGSHKTVYAYDKDNRTTKIQYDGTAKSVAYKYDSMGRIMERKLQNGSAAYDSAYSYVQGDTDMYGPGAMSPLVAGIMQGEGDNAMKYSYAYDDRGNITGETLTRGSGANAATEVTTYR